MLPRWRGSLLPKKSPGRGGLPPTQSERPLSAQPHHPADCRRPGVEGLLFKGRPSRSRGGFQVSAGESRGKHVSEARGHCHWLQNAPLPGAVKRAAVGVREQSQERGCGRGPAPRLRALTSPSFPPTVRGLGQRRSSWAPILLRGGGDRPRRDVPNALPLHWDQGAPVSTPGCCPGSSRPSPEERGKQSPPAPLLHTVPWSLPLSPEPERQRRHELAREAPVAAPLPLSLPAPRPGTHLGAEALGHVPEDVRLHPGQQQLAGGPRCHVPVAQDQRALHFLQPVLTPILRGRRHQRGCDTVTPPSSSPALQPHVRGKKGTAGWEEGATPPREPQGREQQDRIGLGRLGPGGDQGGRGTQEEELGG